MSPAGKLKTTTSLRSMLRNPLSRWSGQRMHSEKDFFVCEKGIVWCTKGNDTGVLGIWGP